jgi:hypothetical protein
MSARRLRCLDPPAVALISPTAPLPGDRGCLLTASHCSGHPDLSRLREDNPPPADSLRVAEAYDRIGKPWPLDLPCGEQGKLSTAKNSSCRKGTQRCPNKKNQRASCRSLTCGARRISSARYSAPTPIKMIGKGSKTRSRRPSAPRCWKATTTAKGRSDARSERSFENETETF